MRVEELGDTLEGEVAVHLIRAVQVQLQYDFEHNILYSYCIHIVFIFNLYVMCINDVV